jgi:transporter family-2 protein
MSGLLFAALAGTLMSIQGVLNTEVTEHTGIWVSNGWVQLSAFLTCVVLWFMNGRDKIGTLLQVEPKYMLLGGVIGSIITFTVIKGMDGLGPAKSVMIIVIVQLLVAYLIELFGIFGVEKVAFEWKKLIGLGIAVIGVVIFKI